MNKAKAIEVAKAYFKNHTVDTLFVTGDEQVFFTKQSGDNHATSLPKDSREVFEVERSEATSKATTAKPDPAKSAETDNPLDDKAQALKNEADAKQKYESAQAKADTENNKTKKAALQEKADKAKKAYDAASQIAAKLSAQ